MGVQLEVVLPAKELLADLALKLAAPAMRGDVAAQVPLAGEHLLTHKTGAKSQQCNRDIAEHTGAREVWQEARGGCFLGKDILRKPSVEGETNKKNSPNLLILKRHVS